MIFHLIYYTKTATRKSFSVNFVLRCSKIELDLSLYLELTLVSKLFTEYLINEMLERIFKIMIDLSESAEHVYIQLTILWKFSIKNVYNNNCKKIEWISN